MATVTILRPSSTTSGVGWSAVPSGTLNAVTSDDNDATYALWSGDGSPMILATPVDTPPAGERRHRVRLRARGEEGDAWWAVRLSNGALVAGAAGQFTVSPGTVTGSWGFGAPPDGSTILYAYVTGQSAGVKINELYLDMDSREAPTFTPQILDGSGAASVTISDTTQPTIRADHPDLDGLAARQYRYWVTSGATVVWDTGVVSGGSVDRQTTPLDNGSYVAHLQIWTTLGSNTAYASDEETLAFTVSVGLIPAPDNPTVDIVDGTPFYLIEACAPYTGDFDGGTGYIEVQRVDCPGMAVPVNRVSGNFDSDVSGWASTGGSLAWSNAFTHEGHGSALLTVVGSPAQTYLRPDGVANSAVVVPGRTYRTTFWLYAPVAIASVTAAIDWFDAGVNYLSGEYDTSSIGAGTWTRFEVDGVAPVGAAYGNYGPTIVDVNGTQLYATQITFEDITALTEPPMAMTTVAILGPLATGECAEWTDFTLPRTGAYDVCSHDPEPCCSYYRARTLGRVDGALRISNWSDFFDPAMPLGLIVMWPSTEASIPDGWNRVSELDGLYLKGVPDDTTNPGTLGGSATHTHTLPTHTHDTSHLHTTTSPTAAATGTVNAPNTAGALKALTTHTHTRPSTDSATVLSGTATPPVATNSNDVERLEVIYVQSDGTPLGVPNGAIAHMPDISVSGWTDYANAANRFTKGVIGATGGVQIGSAINSHVHALTAHAHNGTSHVHTSANTGNFSSTLAPATGSGSVVSAATHNHPITVNTSPTQNLASGGGANSGAAGSSILPPYRNLRVRENISGGPDLPVGLICAWRGSLGAIPNFWQLCDGTNGTPDMFGLYPRGATAAIGASGGSAAGHTHTSASHTHTTTGHSHTSVIGATTAASSTANTTATVAIATAAHTHALVDTASTTPTVASSTSGTLANSTQDPPHEEVAFIQLVDTPVPPPDPGLFCLNWDPEQHLIRTLGPDGPMWANVGGQFTWDVVRPFTAANGVMGSRFVTSAPPGGRNLHMTAAVENEEELATLHAVLARPLVLISPSDAEEVWAAPVAESVTIVKIGRIRQVTADFIGTGPQPPPQLADVGV